ncbi:anti-sigma-I factor RsgI family protein [Paenibacillus sp. KN14-4R]|uniref:anti-sigma-I factor RsgI family protein n=1 Tax=Paenibacillus sp. KN14-4R TaxID=3445773 RepID=UPI003F9F7350
MQGVVFKITDNRIVVLCDDGKFRNLPHSPVMPALGEKITLPELPLANEKQTKVWKINKRWMAVASFLLLVSLTLILNLTLLSTPTVAMVAIDINPSIELFVDSKGKVNKASLMNEDAKWMISEKELKGKEFYEAIQIIISKAKEQGYLDLETDKKFVLMSIVDTGKASFQVDPNKVTPEENDVQLELYYTDQQQQEKAKEAGLTLNKYIVYEQAKQMGVEIQLEELRTHSVVSSLNQAGVDPQLFFKKEKKSNREEPKEKKEHKEPKEQAHTPEKNVKHEEVKPASKKSGDRFEDSNHKNKDEKEKEVKEKDKAHKNEEKDKDPRNDNEKNQGTSKGDKDRDHKDKDKGKD